MDKKKIAVCYFSYWKDIDFLNESLKVLEATIARHPEYEVRTYVFDDGRSEKKLKKKELHGSPTLISTTFDRKGNLNGFECIDGMFKEYRKIQEKFDYDYIIKLDSDCVINSFDYLCATEEHLKNNNIPLEQLGQFGTYFAQLCCCGCWQNFTKIGVNTICNLFAYMNRGSNQQEVIMKKRVINGYNEDKVVSVLMEMAPVVRINVDAIPNMKGCLNAFNGAEVDYTTYSAVAFKPNVFANTSTWDREKSLAEMKKHTENIISKKKTKTVIPLWTQGTRFGNELFLVAACYAHCLRNNYELKIGNIKDLLKRSLSKSFPVPTKEECKSTIFVEPTYHYTPIPKYVTGLIQGFYQSSKHFTDYSKEVKELFGNLKSEEKWEGAAGIHVRMGDYLQHDWRYKSPKKDFIEKALAQLSPHINRLVIFSDEPNKAMELIRSCNGSEKYGIINGSAESDEINDIRSMTACEELIMSCSSFSWWAAYLGEHNKVIVDKKWYNDNGLIDKDIYEDNWIKI